MLNSTDELEHGLTHVIGLTRSATSADSFVEVAIGTVLEDEVDVVFGLEVMDEIDDIRMIANAAMDGEFLGAVVDNHGLRATDNSRGLGEALQSYEVASPGVVGLEDHAKGAMVER